MWVLSVCVLRVSCVFMYRTRRRMTNYFLPKANFLIIFFETYLLIFFYTSFFFHLSPCSPPFFPRFFLFWRYIKKKTSEKKHRWGSNGFGLLWYIVSTESFPLDAAINGNDTLTKASAPQSKTGFGWVSVWSMTVRHWSEMIALGGSCRLVSTERLLLLLLLLSLLSLFLLSKPLVSTSIVLLLSFLGSTVWLRGIRALMDTCSIRMQAKVDTFGAGLYNNYLWRDGRGTHELRKQKIIINNSFNTHHTTRNPTHYNGAWCAIVLFIYLHMNGSSEIARVDWSFRRTRNWMTFWAIRSIVKSSRRRSVRHLKGRQTMCPRAIFLNKKIISKKINKTFFRPTTPH